MDEKLYTVLKFLETTPTNHNQVLDDLHVNLVFEDRADIENKIARLNYAKLIQRDGNKYEVTERGIQAIYHYEKHESHDQYVSEWQFLKLQQEMADLQKKVSNQRTIRNLALAAIILSILAAVGIALPWILHLFPVK